jgi:hypothetical protein
MFTRYDTFTQDRLAHIVRTILRITTSFAEVTVLSLSITESIIIFFLFSKHSGRLKDSCPVDKRQSTCQNGRIHSLSARLKDGSRLAPSTCDLLVIARIAGVVPAITQADSHAWTVKYRCDL